MSAYDIGHYIGMSIEEEYYLLTLMSENERQEYLLRHLQKTIPTIVELQKLKERIQLNGHFRKLSVNDDESTWNNNVWAHFLLFQKKFIYFYCLI